MVLAVLCPMCSEEYAGLGIGPVSAGSILYSIASLSLNSETKMMAIRSSSFYPNLTLRQLYSLKLYQYSQDVLLIS